MALEQAREQLPTVDLEQPANEVPGHVVCPEAKERYSVTIDGERFYFESMAELDRFLARSTRAARLADDESTIGELESPGCPLHHQTGVDAVRDFISVLARLSPEEFTAYQRECAARQAELKLL